VAVAYSAFANGGYIIKPQFIYSIREPGGGIIYQNDFSYEKERILSERSALLVSTILQKATREGTGASMNSTYAVSIPMAGKTGTSQNYADAWFASFNPGLTIVARAGASTRAVHFNSGSDGSGAALALPLVAMTLRKTEKDPTLRDQLFRPFPDLPPELERALDCPDYRDKKLIFKFIDIFKRRDPSMKKVETHPETKPEKRSLLKRIFNK
jgi:penicillin-binding protein 1A